MVARDFVYDLWMDIESDLSGPILDYTFKKCKKYRGMYLLKILGDDGLGEFAEYQAAAARQLGLTF